MRIFLLYDVQDKDGDDASKCTPSSASKGRPKGYNGEIVQRMIFCKEKDFKHTPAL